MYGLMLFFSWAVLWGYFLLNDGVISINKGVNNSQTNILVPKKSEGTIYILKRISATITSEFIIIDFKSLHRVLF